ncbi:inosine-uridine preferring nucleoside hydrolase-like protein [Xylona heveae TC161]|uniref:Inosine-uridine preferring nucleoside hydrolase-like protein n=1 Tax=Xylona heveae (strain CBS 132557 / TC161) TaxID=1328760 RepID=A0A165GJF4_XYLHT|nr:inosine-uridine preferring nucleoside hydrolase-like protein [Xylona heveae TC161]KZF22261.1 inosine-uridine preferring nucleoside hydrolase-like protein [Xylona heveae TC161]
MAPNRIIIDTDPGVDDVLAILLALSAKPEELEVLMLSLTFGNIDVANCLRNAVTMFHVLEREIKWRQEQGLPTGFDTLRSKKPLVAVGSEEPLADQRMMADYFHGTDGLGGIHFSHPHLTPAETWKELFSPPRAGASAAEVAAARDLAAPNTLFEPSTVPAPDEILRILRENEPDTITIVAIGPLTNLAKAAAKDPETFLRVKEVVVMGCTIDVEGNITPVAEFNTYADSYAAARVFALTSPAPSTTMPPAMPPSTKRNDPSSPSPPPFLPPYPSSLSRQLKVTIFPLDITTPHVITRGVFDSMMQPRVAQGSPLAEWVSLFVESTFRKIESLQEGVPEGGVTTGLSLHDPLTVWYCLAQSSPAWLLSPNGPEDIRVETSGQWTRGMCVVDRRNRRKRPDDGEGGEIPSDTGNWLNPRAGNRIRRVIATPGEEEFGAYMLGRILS